MARVDITLNGREYPIACEDGQEPRVRDIAHLLDARLRDLRRAAPNASDQHLLVMAALMIGDALFDTQAALEQAQAAVQADGRETPDAETAAAVAVGRLAERVETIAARLEAP